MSIVRYLNPWRFRRAEAERRLAELRQRDGDNCRRCRRPLRFDLPKGHDQAASIQPIASNGERGIDNLCLTHTRCNPGMVDHTGEVVERVRRKAEAELFAKPRKARKTKRAA